MDPDFATLSHTWFPDSLFHEIAKLSNSYILQRYQSIDQVTPPTITSSELKRFVAITMYLGIADLTSKRDYWSSHSFLPSRSVTNELSRNIF